MTPTPSLAHGAPLGRRKLPIGIQTLLKVVELTPEGRALQQLQTQGYADKYKARNEPIHLVGVEFSKASRNIVGFEVQTLEPDAIGRVPNIPH